jgi:mRNA interferase HigB
MRIVKQKTLRDFISQSKYKRAEVAIVNWASEVKAADWVSAQELKQQYRNASILSSKRVVFNIKENEFRLLVDIEYRLRIIFIVWFGTHSEYDAIDANTITYER